MGDVTRSLSSTSTLFGNTVTSESCLDNKQSYSDYYARDRLKVKLLHYFTIKIIDVYVGGKVEASDFWVKVKSDNSPHFDEYNHMLCM